MKSTFFKEYFDEVVLEVDDSYQGTIRKLQAQQGICSEEASEGDLLVFRCDKKGKFRIDTNVDRRRNSISDFRPYYVEGRVLEKDGKTVVEISSVFDKTNLFFQYFKLATLGISLVLGIILGVASETFFSTGTIILFALSAGLLFSFFFNNAEQRSSDLNLMREQVIRRVENMKRWE